jgi:CheY-like chemotaxis protein
VRSGDQVLQACDPALPARAEAVVLDVGVPGVMAFEVMDQLRAHPSTKELPVILLASVFERTRYKRRPNQLYGADAYLELHHVPDRLVTLLDALRSKEPLPEERVQAPADRARAAALRAEVTPLDDDGLVRVARRVLSDMALYHGDEIARGVAEGEPLAHVQDALAGARQLFEELAAERIALFEEEVEDFVARLNERDRVRRRANG